MDYISNPLISLEHAAILQFSVYGNFAYCVLQDSPIVIKVDLVTMQTVATATLSDPAKAIVCNGTNVYVGLDKANPATVVKLGLDLVEVASPSRWIDSNSFSGVGRLILSASQANTLFAMHDDTPANISGIATTNMLDAGAWADDDTSGGTPMDIMEFGGYIYISYYTGDGVEATVSRIKITDSSVTHWTSGNVLKCNGYHLTNDGTSVYVGLDTDPAYVIKITPATMTTAGTWTGAAGQVYAMGLCTDGSVLYVGTETAPFQVVAVDPATMATISSYVGPATMRSAYNLIIVDTDLYVAHSDANLHARIDKLDNGLTFQKRWKGEDGLHLSKVS